MRRSGIKTKVALALLTVVILASTLTVYYLESSPGSKSSFSSPSLVYDFNSTLYGGSFLGWNTSGGVAKNNNHGVSFYSGGFLSRQFRALSPDVCVSFDWETDATMVVSRQSGGIYQNLTYAYDYVGARVSSSDVITNTTSFEVDNSTTFTLQFEASTYPIATLYRVKLWNCTESS